jgi:hypothetical protein
VSKECELIQMCFCSTVSLIKSVWKQTEFSSCRKSHTDLHTVIIRPMYFIFNSSNGMYRVCP